MNDAPSIVFVCVKNAGKSQMAAALMRKLAGEAVEVHSAGTRPGNALNPLAVESLAEVGVDTGDERPKPIDRDLLNRVERVIVLGREAQVVAPDGVSVQTWLIDEPSDRGVDGIERMRLIRDEIAERVGELCDEFDMRSRRSATKS
jgi:arsenate-mycothiol transferase